MHNPTTFVIFAPMTNNHKIVDYDAVLDAKFGKEGTPERARAEEAAYSFYSGQILQDARKEAKMTQSELAERTQTTKSYISKIENGVITPSVGMFYRIIAALEMRFKGSSQYGNVWFPTWEHFVPLMGMFFVIKERPLNT